MEQESSRRRNVLKRCGVSEQDTHRSSFTNHLRTDGFYLKHVEEQNVTFVG